jgi:two-component system response regulator MprA
MLMCSILERPGFLLFARRSYSDIAAGRVVGHRRLHIAAESLQTPVDNLPWLKFGRTLEMWILVAEDDPCMGQAIMQGFQEANHSVTLARNGLEALAAVDTRSFDALILDVMMPGLSGIEVAKYIRKSGSDLPILMLTARDAAADIVEGLDAGADDYLVKPFSFKVLLARLRAISRRACKPTVATLQVDDLTLDPASRVVARAGRDINLTATEFRLLEYLMRRPGRAVSRSTIIEAIWGFEEDVAPNTVDVYIKLLRDKIDMGQQLKLIHTVRGYGYILRE